MVHRLTNRVMFIPLLLLTMASGACRKAENPTANSSDPPNIKASPAAPQSKGIETEAVTPEAVAGAIQATGKVLVPENRMAVIGPVHEGRLVRLYAGQGNHVKKGQKLADLQSADLDQAEADYLKAVADYDNARRTGAVEIKLAQETYDRTRLLFEKTITAGKNLQTAEHDLELAKATSTSAIASTKAELAAAQSHLFILGLSESAVNSLANKTDRVSLFSLISPIDGILVERNATIGATVGTDANLFKIIDLASVWIDANVFEKDLARVRLGQEVKVATPSIPGSSFSGRVILISSVVDPDTSTVKVRTELPNRDGRLKPVMFANVQIITDYHPVAVSIPQTAVLDDGGKSVVFVAAANGYEKREVKVGIQSGDRIEILYGLDAGDKVVVKGNYLLLQQSKPEQ